MNKILKQSGLTNRLDDVVKVMNRGRSSDITVGLEEEFGSADIHTQRVMSDESSHIILIKGLSAKRREEQLAKIEEESSAMEEGNEDCCIVGETENVPITDSDNELLIDSDNEETVHKEKGKRNINSKNEVIYVSGDSGVKPESESEKDAEIVTDISKNRQSETSDIGEHKVSDVIKSDKICVVNVDDEQKEIMTSNVIDVDEDEDDSPCLIINEEYSEASPEKESVPKKRAHSEEVKGPAKTRKYDRDGVIDVDAVTETFYVGGKGKRNNPNLSANEVILVDNMNTNCIQKAKPVAGDVSVKNASPKVINVDSEEADTSKESEGQSNCRTVFVMI